MGRTMRCAVIVFGLCVLLSVSVHAGEVASHGLHKTVKAFTPNFSGFPPGTFKIQIEAHAKWDGALL
ncbi:MAG: hypothetical protein ACYTHN_22855, partial [Planctomycetota bacterium]